MRITQLERFFIVTVTMIMALFVFSQVAPRSDPEQVRLDWKMKNALLRNNGYYNWEGFENNEDESETLTVKGLTKLIMTKRAQSVATEPADQPFSKVGLWVSGHTYPSTKMLDVLQIITDDPNKIQADEDEKCSPILEMAIRAYIIYTSEENMADSVMGRAYHGIVCESVYNPKDTDEDEDTDTIVYKADGTKPYRFMILEPRNDTLDKFIVELDCMPVHAKDEWEYDDNITIFGCHKQWTYMPDKKITEILESPPAHFKKEIFR